MKLILESNIELTEGLKDKAKGAVDSFVKLIQQAIDKAFESLLKLRAMATKNPEKKATIMAAQSKVKAATSKLKSLKAQVAKGEKPSDEQKAQFKACRQEIVNALKSAVSGKEPAVSSGASAEFALEAEDATMANKAKQMADSFKNKVKEFIKKVTETLTNFKNRLVILMKDKNANKKMTPEQKKAADQARIRIVANSKLLSVLKGDLSKADDVNSRDSIKARMSEVRNNLNQIRADLVAAYKGSAPESK